MRDICDVYIAVLLKSLQFPVGVTLSVGLFTNSYRYVKLRGHIPEKQCVPTQQHCYVESYTFLFPELYVASK